MPWEHCGAEVRDDQDCPSCGISKEAWTVEIQVTRTFQVKRKPALRFKCVDRNDEPVPEEPFRVELPGGVVEGRTDEFGMGKAIAEEEGRAELTFVGRDTADVTARGDEGPEATGQAGQPARFDAAIDGRRHTFEIVGHLRLKLIDRDGVALEGLPWALSVNDELLEGTTGSGEQAGLIDQEVPPQRQLAELTVRREGRPELILQVKLGQMPAAEDLTGVQARLNNLGFGCGKVDDDLGVKTDTALRTFQQHHGLQVTGQADDATRQKLQELYGA